jgi:hypothetical protein
MPAKLAFFYEKHWNTRLQGRVPNGEALAEGYLGAFPCKSTEADARTRTGERVKRVEQADSPISLQMRGVVRDRRVRGSPWKSTALQRCVPTVFQWGAEECVDATARSGLSPQGAETGLRSGFRSRRFYCCSFPSSSEWRAPPALSLSRETVARSASGAATTFRPNRARDRAASRALALCI